MITRSCILILYFFCFFIRAYGNVIIYCWPSSRVSQFRFFIFFFLKCLRVSILKDVPQWLEEGGNCASHKISNHPVGWKNFEIEGEKKKESPRLQTIIFEMNEKQFLQPSCKTIGFFYDGCFIHARQVTFRNLKVMADINGKQITTTRKRLLWRLREKIRREF